jgi:hypothetical protein
MHYVGAAKWLSQSLRDQAFAESGSGDIPETLRMVTTEGDRFSSAPAKCNQIRAALVNGPVNCRILD